MRVLHLPLVLAASLLAGCVQATEGDCMGVLNWNGVRYTSNGTAGPPPLGEALGEGSILACDDGGGAEGEREVMVFAVEGVDSEAAVALEGFDGGLPRSGLHEELGRLPAGAGAAHSRSALLRARRLRRRRRLHPLHGPDLHP